MRFTEWLSEILYPERCMLCGSLPEEESERFRLLGVCEMCSPEEYRFSEEELQTLPADTYVCYQYEDRLREAVGLLKYEGRKNFGKYLGRWAVMKGQSDFRLGRIFRETDLIVPIPVSDKRKKERGYNQAEVIAESVGESLKIPVADILKRARETGAQKKLGGRMRLRNLEGAFSVDEVKASQVADAAWRKVKDGHAGHPLRMMVIDDIYTTGATLFEAKKTLQKRFPGVKISLVAICGRCSQGFFEDPVKNL